MVCSLISDNYFESFSPLSYYALQPEVACFHFWGMVLLKFAVKSSKEAKQYKFYIVKAY